jgi:hypothetical protein
VIEGVADKWAAVGAWTAEHLVERCGEEQVTAFVTDKSLQGTVLQQVNSSFTTGAGPPCSRSS